MAVAINIFITVKIVLQVYNNNTQIQKRLIHSLIGMQIVKLREKGQFFMNIFKKPSERKCINKQFDRYLNYAVSKILR